MGTHRQREKREHKREEEVVRKQQERFQKQVKMKGVLKRDGFCGFVVLVLDERDGWMDGWMDELTRVSRPRLHSCQTC